MCRLTKRAQIDGQKTLREPCFYQCFIHVSQAGTDLNNVPEVAVGSQLQALPLRPAFDGHEPLAESGAPVVGAQAGSVGPGARQLVEEPGADEVEELGEELDGEGGVDPTAA